MQNLAYSHAEILNQFSMCNNLQALIQVIERQLSDKGRVVCKIKVNGIVLSEKDEARFADTDLMSIQQIEVESEATDQLLASAMEGLRAHLLQMQEAAVKAADLFRSGDMPKAQQYFAQVVTAHKDITDSLVVLRPLVLNRFVDRTEPWVAAESHMGASIKELFNAYEQKDFVLVADILEYELSTGFEKWVTVLSC